MSMTKIFENKEKILASFIEICNENSLWYSLDGNSLLAAINNLDYWYNADHYEVFMTFESYEKLKQLYPKKILDATMHSDYYSLQNKFLEDISLMNEDSAFININIIIPTAVKKIHSFFNLKNKIKSFCLHYYSMDKSDIYAVRQKIRISRLIKPFIKGLNYKDFNEFLYDKKYEGFLITSPLINRGALRKWLTNTNFERIKIKKNNLEIYVIAEYQNYLKNLFGSSWKQISQISIPYYYIDTKNIIKN
ncbi:hypothetical protein [Metamycoplasma auris]|uniref:Lipopolysaccharide cholinephosphotransferase n=1 Tax=Metamycoplasma auris TaxID=51363 RepID=A0A2W7GRT6_9BACT|nr:hypothetical protein [Metamycoplasma auris]PZV99968.1 lipopolysaccharide cholinephosphotransferase [Metamycoplasma auris]